MQLSNYSFGFGLKVAGMVVFFCFLAMAQQTLSEISGVVIDPTGALIPGALVRIKNKNTGVEQQVRTNEEGRYKASVPVGLYDLTVEIPGFKRMEVSDVAVVLGQSKSINFAIGMREPSESLALPPPPQPPPQPPPGNAGGSVSAGGPGAKEGAGADWKGPAAGFTRVELTWNAWAEPASPTPSFSPVPFLEPQDKSYSLVLDLAALAYGDGSDLFHRSARDTLRDWVLKSNAPDVDLKLLIIPDERFFKTTSRIVTLRIDLKRLRQAFKSGVDVSRDPFEMLRENATRDFSFGRVQINLRTLGQEGTGSVAIALWADGVMPVDELSIPLCVASNAEAAKKCEIRQSLQDSLSGIDPVRAAAQREASALRPDAALHFIELDSSTQVGIFRDNAWPEGQFVSWRLAKSAKATRQYLQQTLLHDFDEALTDSDLSLVGLQLYNLLFPTPDAADAQKAFADFIRRNRDRKDPANPPSIFVRMLSDDNDDPPFLIPLGVMVHDFDGKEDFLGFHFRIQTPLEIQDYQPYSKCIGSWVVVAPPANASGVPSELNEARAHFSDWFKTWNLEPISGMRPFIDWARQNVSETNPVSLFILAHQDSNSLFYGPSPRLGSELIVRRFKTPSVAVVNGCATGAPGSSLIVQKLNSRGVSAVIATAGKVDRHLAGDFFSVLGDFLTRNPAGREYPLGVAHFLTLQKLRNMTPASSNSAYGAKVLAYELLGNSSLRICSPPRRSRKPS